MNNVNTTVPPQDSSAEDALLGAMLLNSQAVDLAIEIVEPGDFYQPSRASIFSAIVTLYNSARAVDTITVCKVLEDQSLLESVGGPSTLVHLVNNTPSLGNADSYARIVRATATFRRALAMYTELSANARQGGDIDIHLDSAESGIYSLRDEKRLDSIVSIESVVRSNIENAIQAIKEGVAFEGVSTGFSGLDKLLGGLKPATLCIIGARPAMGKTSFALSLLKKVSVDRRLPSLFCSLEMTASEIATRLMANECSIDASALHRFEYNDLHILKLQDGLARIGGAPLFVDESPTLTLLDLRARARRIASKQGLSLLVVDYIQLMHSRGRFESRQVEVAELSRGLKSLARELRVPIIALSQLHRGLESRSDKRPMLADLRESGALEQDADIVAFLYRDEVYNPNEAKAGLAEVIVAKNRNGPTGTVPLVFTPSFLRFSDN